MCGILGISTCGGSRLSIADSEVERLRDLMTHRGPDGRGLWRDRTTVLAHRRLAILDQSPAGRQPMATRDGRFLIVYNGEIYNEPDLRARLAAAGIRPGSGCDTETLLLWLEHRGDAGLADLRGMFALALLDTREKTLLLARDPLGIKPLYWWKGRSEGSDLLLFASEPAPILAHGDVPVRPDPVGVSAYLSTIRTTLGDRTLFEGVRAVEPGAVLTIDLAAERLSIRTNAVGLPGAPLGSDEASHRATVRAEVETSTRLHLRADVPVCCMLSGGLDSAILTTIAAKSIPELSTYCAGATPTANGTPDDVFHAEVIARQVGSTHTVAHIDESLFLSRWRDIIRRQGLPLSTPNEVAINEIARLLRSRGHVVAISGEGADELFGGYHHPLSAAARHVEEGNDAPGRFQLDVASWFPSGQKSALLNPEAWAGMEQDAWLHGFFEDEFRRTARGADPLADHLRFQRRVNLVGLLARLDSATMLESVEGRTPFADVAVAALAESLPMSTRFEAPDRTKIVLREAFAPDLPRAVIERPKASFPLPFENWIGDSGALISGSPLVRDLVQPEALSLVSTHPSKHWRLAWPLANLALWAERWWPRGAVHEGEAMACGSPSPAAIIQ